MKELSITDLISLMGLASASLNVLGPQVTDHEATLAKLKGLCNKELNIRIRKLLNT